MKPKRKPERSMLASSACGVCGTQMIDDLRHDLAVLPAGLRVDPSTLPGLVEILRSGQGVFDRTGGLHAAGLFDAAGHLIALREDVGRHNAVDKVVGRMLLDGRLPASDTLLVVSGRAGYEIVQKSIGAGIPLLAAVGAPSSLAVALAREFNQTLVGFLKGDRFNVYSSHQRLTND
jgi:FdhD protein